MNDELLLFTLPPPRVLQASERSEPFVKTEEPWLQPIWRDPCGDYHYARFELIYRYFCTHKIHEVVFAYLGQHEVGGFPGYDRDTGYRVREDLERFLRDEWPEPIPAGQMKADHIPRGRTIYTVLIYCDDLFLCDSCGRFHPHNRTVRRFPWLRKDDSIDHERVRTIVEERRFTPEFRIKSCCQTFCRELRKQTIERMKRSDEARARAAAFNLELRRTRSTSVFPESATAKKGYVYAVQSGRYVKIGVASDVTKRVLALQTSSPTRLTVVNAWRHYDAERMERSLHNKFKKYRGSGEWFRLPSAEIHALKRADRIDQIASDQ